MGTATPTARTLRTRLAALAGFATWVARVFTILALYTLAAWRDGLHALPGDAVILDLLKHSVGFVIPFYAALLILRALSLSWRDWSESDWSDS